MVFVCHFHRVNGVTRQTQLRKLTWIYTYILQASDLNVVYSPDLELIFIAKWNIRIGRQTLFNV